MFYDKIKGMNTSTTRSITYNGDRIEYELTIKRVKNMNMRITRDGVIHVSANGYVPDYVVDKFVIENMPFIERARYKIDALNAKRIDALQYVNGESLSILGIPVTLRLVEQDGKPHIGFDGKAILTMVVPRGTPYEAKHKLMQSYWRNLGEKVFVHWAKVVYQRFQNYNIDVPMPTIKQQRMKSRWGSCTPAKQLIKMNTRLLEGPQAYIEYVMVHEFAHFKYLDHSKNFHNLVAQFLPDWKARKKSLNVYFAHRP